MFSGVPGRYHTCQQPCSTGKYCIKGKHYCLFMTLGRISCIFHFH